MPAAHRAHRARLQLHGEDIGRVVEDFPLTFVTNYSKKWLLSQILEKDHPKAKQTEWQISTRLVVRQSSAFPRGTLPALAAANEHGK